MFFIFLLLLVDTTKSLSVGLTGEWLADIGGFVNCSWVFEDSDSLQSVKIYYGNQELVVFRPEIHLTELSTAVRVGGHMFDVDCYTRQRGRKLGSCIVKTSAVPQPPPPELYWFACEVSGERPYFRVVRKTLKFKPFLAASNAILETTEDLSRGRAKLNCTSTGLPAPSLQWKVANTLTTPDFSGSKWNSTTKLWEVWSSLSVTHSADKALEVSCVPTQEGLDAQDSSATFTLNILNSAKRIQGIYSIVIAFLLPVYILS